MADDDFDPQILLSLPRLKTGDKRVVFVNCYVSPEVETELKTRGWETQDIRLLPSESEVERSLIVKATLDGVRMGTITMTTMQLRILELEAKITGLLAIKEVPAEEGPKVDNLSLADLLKFGANSTLSVSGETDGIKPTTIPTSDKEKFRKRLAANKKIGRLVEDK